LTHVYLDASALVKRYRQESGSAVVNDTINSADAIHVAILLTLQVALHARSDYLLCLAADKRLVQAVRAEVTSVG
jgi:predicted nucleic acid-binding protein